MPWFSADSVLQTSTSWPITPDHHFQVCRYFHSGPCVRRTVPTPTFSQGIAGGAIFLASKSEAILWVFRAPPHSVQSDLSTLCFCDSRREARAPVSDRCRPRCGVTVSPSRVWPASADFKLQKDRHPGRPTSKPSRETLSLSADSLLTDGSASATAAEMHALQSAISAGLDAVLPSPCRESGPRLQSSSCRRTAFRAGGHVRWFICAHELDWTVGQPTLPLPRVDLLLQHSDTPKILLR
jgi:hypothetical protein